MESVLASGLGGFIKFDGEDESSQGSRFEANQVLIANANMRRLTIDGVESYVLPIVDGSDDFNLHCCQSYALPVSPTVTVPREEWERIKAESEAMKSIGNYIDNMTRFEATRTGRLAIDQWRKLYPEWPKMNGWWCKPLSPTPNAG